MIVISDLITEHLRGQTLFAFSGRFDKNVSDDLVTQVDDLLSNSSLPTRIRKKVFSISIEMIQNLYHYLEGVDEVSHHGDGAFVITEIGDEIQIMSANFIDKDDINSLSSRINMVNNLPEENLGHLYRGVLDIGGVSSKGGAGLGFIDIRKKCGNPLDCSFTDFSNDHALYVLKITI